ncbi:antibiotic resistance protein VanZ [Saccharibacillus alkalitolerans]|uniref:Antibiotic resistance protein VanZ n=1 Tax=Saccharibacillus alkalitolerans TaxID=2705290 RepID=A0ABX0F0N6_9BACL|nr:antibiotic resistance protein VanZ [Saccharibacillus alkalitolerans]NGZ74072.1 antibiotic resistance protein VanZ [Saccharibacillus alkalitolerans]
MNHLFYGTRLFYDWLYFATSMSPAYLLFLLQLNKKFNKPFDCTVFGFHVTIYHWCMLALLVLACLAVLLRSLLYWQFNKGIGDPVLAPQLPHFSKNNLAERNGSVIAFLLGTILPAVLVMENSLVESLAVFIILQFILFVLIKKSSDIFPNIMLLLLGIDLCKTNQGNYLFILAGTDHDAARVYKIGDPAKSKTYITAYKK